MSFDLPVKMLDGTFVDEGRFLCLEVGHTFTPTADKMDMRMGIIIKMIHSVPQAQPGDLSEIGQQCEIAVNGPQADVGKFVSYMSVHHICRRVITSGHQELFNSLPLTAVFQRHFRFPSSKTIIVTIIIIVRNKVVNLFMDFLENNCLNFISLGRFCVKIVKKEKGREHFAPQNAAARRIPRRI